MIGASAKQRYEHLRHSSCIHDLIQYFCKLDQLEKRLARSGGEDWYQAGQYKVNEVLRQTSSQKLRTRVHKAVPESQLGSFHMMLLACSHSFSCIAQSQWKHPMPMFKPGRVGSYIKCLLMKGFRCKRGYANWPI